MRHSAVAKNKDEAGYAIFCIRVLIRTKELDLKESNKFWNIKREQSYIKDDKITCGLLLQL